jgi:DNA-binding transcriptional MerR regulator
MASKISGVGVHTIRAWEKRYKALVPNRDSSGHRTYTKTDIEKLMLLSELCLLGYTISKVAKYDISELKLLLKDLGKSEISLDSPEFNLIKEKNSIDPSGSTSILLFALRAYKLDVVNLELSKLKTMVNAKEMALSLLLPLAQELAELKSSGVYTAVQEETAVSLLRFHAGLALYRPNERKEKNSINVIIAGLETHSNEINLLMAGLLSNYYGFNYNFLGHSLSVESIVESANFLNVHMIIINAHSLSPVQSFVEKLIAKGPTNFNLLIFGKIDLNFERIPTKRVKICRSIDELDEYLSQK